MSDDVFERIAEAAQDLNVKADQVAHRVRDAEDALERAKAGYEVADSEPFYTEEYTTTASGLAGDTPDGPEPTITIVHEWKLAYLRYGSRFRICVRISTDDLPEEPQIKPVLDFDRQTRLRAVKRLPAFLEVIAQRLEEAANSTNVWK